MFAGERRWVGFKILFAVEIILIKFLIADLESCIVNQDCTEPDSSCVMNICTPPVTKKDASVQTQSFDSYDNVNRHNLNSSNAKAKRLKDIRYIKLSSTTSNDTKFSSVDSTALEEEDGRC